MVTSPFWIQLFSALRLSLAAVCSLYIAMRLGLENPYWAPVTLMVIEAGFQGMVMQRINERVWGTLLGVVLGLSVLFVAGEMRFVLIALCFALVTLTTYLSLEYRSHLLLWRWTALTIMLMVVIGLSYDYDTYFMTNLSRLWSILVGISVSWAFHVVFFPLASALGILFTLRKITGLLRAISTETDTTGQVTALAGFYVNMETLHHLLSSHSLEKYGTAIRAGQARHVLEALETVGEQVIIARGKAQEFVTSILDTLDTVNPLVVTSLPAAGTQLGTLCAESPAGAPGKLIRAAERMGRELESMDMSVARKTVPAASAPVRAYFFDSWYDDTFTNGYKAVIVGIGTAVGLWLWSEVAWPGGLFMVLLVMLLGQFTAFTHVFPVKALAVLAILSLIITNLLMIFIIPVFDSTSGFFVWLFLLHLFFCWFAFSANKTLAFASLTVLIMLNLFINGYSATPYAMQMTLMYSWGVAGGLLFGIITALLVKPVSTYRLLEHQQDAFFEEISRLDSVGGDERQDLVRSLRQRVRMATVWWRGLAKASDQQAESRSVLDMVARIPEVPDMPEAQA
jgi:uncharacterized membrane protein YccC